MLAQDWKFDLKKQEIATDQWFETCIVQIHSCIIQYMKNKSRWKPGASWTRIFSSGSSALGVWHDIKLCHHNYLWVGTKQPHTGSVDTYFIYIFFTNFKWLLHVKNKTNEYAQKMWWRGGNKAHRGAWLGHSAMTTLVHQKKRNRKIQFLQGLQT